MDRQQQLLPLTTVQRTIMNNDPQYEDIHYILTHYRTVAVVGFSDSDRRKAAFYAPLI